MSELLDALHPPLSCVCVRISRCYKRSVCGIGVEVCSAPDGSVRVASVTPGGEVCVWRERVRKRETER